MVDFSCTEWHHEIFGVSNITQRSFTRPVLFGNISGGSGAIGNFMDCSSCAHSHISYEFPSCNNSCCVPVRVTSRLTKGNVRNEVESCRINVMCGNAELARHLVRR